MNDRGDTACAEAGVQVSLERRLADACSALALSGAALAVLSWSTGSAAATGTVTGDRVIGNLLIKTDTTTFQPGLVDAGQAFDLTIVSLSKSVGTIACTGPSTIPPTDVTSTQASYFAYRVTPGEPSAYDFGEGVSRPPQVALFLDETETNTRREYHAIECENGVVVTRTIVTLTLRVPGGLPQGCYQKPGGIKDAARRHSRD